MVATFDPNTAIGLSEQNAIDLAICLGGGAISLLWFEMLKQATKIRS
jgi:hypothetical protein